MNNNLVAAVIVISSLPGGLAAEPVVISEVMARNESTLADAHGRFEDWIEIRTTSIAYKAF